MQLKRLEAYGFKSFADRISIEFDKGITAIVGPNGSGKSNITDAIRWVLGEQSIRNLRAARSEDVIFAGSATRKALGVAEVSLFFDNDGTLPLDFREVVITRRLYRSGESEFYINRSRCRLKDIYDLFADTGIGHEGMSIIGQNRIDDILNSRPEERRAFFEETAGITKYKARKRETLRKLADTEANLVRVQDIIQEIGNQLAPLSEQAEKTRTYNALSTEYKSLGLSVLAHDYRETQQKQQENENRRKEAGDRLLAAEAGIAALEAKKETLAKTLLDVEAAMAKQAQENEAIRLQLEEVTQEQTRLTERKAQSGATRERIERHREELERTLAENAAEIARTTELLAKQKEKLAAMEKALAEEKERAAGFSAHIEEQKKSVQKAQEETAAAQSTLSDRERELAVAERDVEQSESGQASHEETRQALEEKLSALQGQSNALQQRQGELADRHNALTASCREAEDRRRNAEAAAQKSTERLRELEKEESATASKLQFLNRMQESYEGFGRAAKAILTAKAPWRKGLVGAVAELIHVDKEYVTAIEVALGANMQNLVTRDTDTAKEAIAFLKQERLGRVTFLPLSTLVVRQPQKLSYGRADGVIGWASDLALAEAGTEKAIAFLLARTLVVDTLDNALILAKREGYRLRIVTLTGELLNPGGSLSGGSRQRKETSFLGRSEERKSCAKRLQELRGEKNALQETVKKAGEERQRLSREVQDLRQSLQQVELQSAETRASLAQVEKSLQEQQNTIAMAERIRENLQKTYAEKKYAQTLAQKAKRTAEEALARALKQEKEQRFILEDLQQDAEELKELLQTREVDCAVVRQDVVHQGEERKLYEREKRRNEEALWASVQEGKNLVAFLAESEKLLSDAAWKAERIEGELTAGKEAHEALYKQRMEELSFRDALEVEAKKAREQQGRLQEELHQVDIVATRLDIAREEQQETMLRDYGLTPERVLESASEEDVESLRRRMRELKDKLAALGPVNPNAVKEYEELNGRHTFLTAQSEDLIKAKEDLGKILQEMDTAMTEQFTAAFADIRKYFADIFVRLFGGGKAELRLLDDSDVLNAGVDILVTLPQKKRQNLAALSGGERTLTVIALLFSFLRYRPSPFSVLDEIDAPLDEANVARFGKFLREFSEETQFIVVTHRKGTMEVVDTMYGVTIEDAGVSKLLSVRLEDYVNNEEG